MIAHLIKQGHVSAAVVTMSSVVRETGADPEQICVSQVDDVQDDGSDGEDGADDVHEHSEAHLRGNGRCVLAEITELFCFNKNVFTHQARRREPACQDGHNSSDNKLME